MLWIISALLLFIAQFAAVILIEYRRPQKAIAWLAISFLFPWVGFLLYYFVAKEYPCILPFRGKDMNRLEELKESLTSRSKSRMSEELLDQTVRRNEILHAYLNKAISTPVTFCNKTNVYAEGETAFEDILKSIASAKDHIHIQFYIIRDDRLGTRFQRLLIRKAQEGVNVRLLYDGIGCHALGKAYLKELQEAGVETGCFSPILDSFVKRRINYRNHRKIVIVDGQIGYIGGLNIGDEYLGESPKFPYWRDTHFSIQGDAVWWIQYTFLTDWYFVKGQFLTAPGFYPDQEGQGKELVQIIKSGPDETIGDLIFACITTAKKRIYIETPYFIPDSAVLLALKSAAARGVDIRVVIPAVPDSKLVYYATLSYVGEMIRAGVRFYQYKKGFIHSKVMIADDLACSGTSNFDMRSFSGQFEINGMFFDGKVVDSLVEDFRRDLDVSEEIVQGEFEGRPRLRKILEAFARLFSPLF